MTKFSNILKSIAFAATLSGATAATGIAAQAAANPYVQEVVHQLRTIVSTYSDWSVVAADWVSISVSGPGNAAMPVWLEAGVTYKFAARCDSDCRDVDLALFNNRGRELKADRDSDDTPAFDFTPTKTGNYRVKVELADCAARQCKVGVVVLE